MSVKSNAFLQAAQAALDVMLDVGNPVPEGLLNDYTVSQFGIAQIDSAGRCIVIVTCANGAEPAKVRAVCNAAGDVRLYGDMTLAYSLIKKAKMTAGASVIFKRMEPSAPSGDPVARLKATYKGFKAEKLVADRNITEINQRLVALVALGANTAVGTPDHANWLDAGQALLSVQEWSAYSQNKVTTLAAALTAAGIDPLTVV